MVSGIELNDVFTTQMLTENLVVPKAVLQYYHLIGLDDVQLLIVLHLMAGKTDQSLDDLLEELRYKMSSNKENIKKGLALLIEKNIVTIDGKLQLDRLIAPLNRYWLQEINNKEDYPAKTEEISSLYTIFEQEFGRLLSPMEGDQIKDWVEKDRYDYGLIKGALKRSVLRGVLNFKYVDSILREWHRKNLKTVNEVVASESKYNQKDSQAKNPAKSKQNGKTSNKYKDIYMG